jgi:hypothetical protein
VKRLLAVLAVVVASALAASAGPARACSCAPIDARAALASADGAFIGTFLERRVSGQPTSSAAPAVYVFRVLEPVKGLIGSTVEVVAPVSGASCGIEVEVGATIGLFLDRQGSTWTSSLCAQIAPSRLREAARPLPRPDGRGAAAFLVAGRFGAMSALALDARGRTLAYGRGDEDVLALAVCPGSRRTVEVVKGRAIRLVVRRLPDLRVVRRRTLPVFRDASVTPSLHCADTRAADVRLFWTDLNQQGRTARILWIGAQRTRVLWRGTALFSALGRERAFVAAGVRGDRLLRVALATGRATALVRVAPTSSGLFASSDGRRLAAVSSSWLTLAEVGGSGVTTRRVRVSGCCVPRVLFLPGGRLAVSDGSLRIFAADLRELGRVGNWGTSATVFRDGRAVGLEWGGALVSAVLPRGPARRIRTLPSPVAYALVAIPPSS